MKTNFKKTETDEYKKYPEYNFKNNVGYGTKEHYNAIQSNGISIYHRKSFNLFH